MFKFVLFAVAVIANISAKEIIEEEASTTDQNSTKNVTIVKFSLIVEDGDDISIDLTQEIGKQYFTIKKGCSYQIKIYFYVQGDIVSGLRYGRKFYRRGILVDTMTQTMGSFIPKKDLQSFTMQAENAPPILFRKGDYKIKSRLYNDDREEYASWEWHLTVKKGW